MFYDFLIFCDLLWLTIGDECGEFGERFNPYYLLQTINDVLVAIISSGIEKYLDLKSSEG